MVSPKKNYFKSETFINSLRKALFIISTILLLLSILYFLLLTIKFNNLKKETNKFTNIYNCEICIEDLITKWNETELYLRNYTVENTRLNYNKYISNLILLDSLLSSFQRNINLAVSDFRLKELLSKNYKLEGEFRDLKMNLDLLLQMEGEENFIDLSDDQNQKVPEFYAPDSIQMSHYIDSLINFDTTTVRERLNLAERIKFVFSRNEIEKLKINSNQIFNNAQQTLIKTFIEESYRSINYNQQKRYAKLKAYYQELQKKELLVISNKFHIINNFKTLLYRLKDKQQVLLQTRINNNLNLIIESATTLRLFGIINFLILLIYLITLFFYNHLIVRFQNSLKKEITYNNVLVEEKSAYLANLAHELKNPVSIIVSLSNLFKENLLSRQNFENIINSITLTSKMISKMINDILSSDKSSTIEIQNLEISFNPFITIKNVVSTFQILARQKNITLELAKTNEEGCIVNGNEMILNQVLFNLISNAIKYTDQGQVKIYYSLHKIKGIKAELKISVSDTGRGISPSELPNLFKKYYRTNSSYNTSGTGLGLHITKNLLNQAGGNIHVESIENKGSVFSFSITYDLITVESIPEKIQDTEKISSYLNNKSILIIDDNLSNLSYIKHILSFLTNPILSSQDVDTIDNIVKSNHVGLVLTDYYLGENNGSDVLRIFKSTPALTSIPVVLISSSTLHFNKSTGDGYNFDGFIPKPFSPAEFLEELEKIISKK